MEQLWAPWRMQFIRDARGDAKSEGVFAQLRDASDDRASLVLHRGKLSFVVMNRYPYTNGHLLVVPNRAVPELADLQDGELADLMRSVDRSIAVLRERLEAEGINCGFNLGKAAGAGIRDHFHIHVVPRWVGDTNFLPIMSDTRTLPEYLEETYDRLLPGFQALGEK